jgi:hypothetical protein
MCGAAASTTTRSGAEGITIGFGGGAGGGDGFRSALRRGRRGIFAPGAAGVVGIGTRGCGGRDVVRRGSERSGGCTASTLAGANTDLNAIPCPPSPRRLYSVTDGGPRVLTNLLAGPTPSLKSRPEFARSHAARLSCVTLSTVSTIAKSDMVPERPALACVGGGGALVELRGARVRCCG